MERAFPSFLYILATIIITIVRVTAFNCQVAIEIIYCVNEPCAGGNAFAQFFWQVTVRIYLYSRCLVEAFPHYFVYLYICEWLQNRSSKNGIQKLAIHVFLHKKTSCEFVNLRSAPMTMSQSDNYFMLLLFRRSFRWSSVCHPRRNPRQNPSDVLCGRVPYRQTWNPPERRDFATTKEAGRHATTRTRHQANSGTPKSPLSVAAFSAGLHMDGTVVASKGYTYLIVQAAIYYSITIIVFVYHDGSGAC